MQSSQVDQIAVVHMLGKVVGVVEVDQALPVRLDDVGGQQQPGGQVLGDLAGHIVALDAVDGGVLVGVLLLDFLVVALDEAEDPLVGGVGLALQVLDIAVGDIVAGHVVGLDVHQLVLDHILDFLHADRTVQLLAAVGDGGGDLGDLLAAEPELFIYRLVGLRDGHNDLGDIEWDFGAIPFDDLHAVPPPSRMAAPGRCLLVREGCCLPGGRTDAYLYIGYKPLWISACAAGGRPAARGARL